MEGSRFVGKGWGKKFDNGGYVINLSLKIDDLKALPVGEYGDIRLVVGKRKEPDEKNGADWWVKEDTYERKAKPKPVPDSGKQDTDLPF